MINKVIKGLFVNSRNDLFLLSHNIISLLLFKLLHAKAIMWLMLGRYTHINIYEAVFDLYKSLRELQVHA